MEEDEDSTEPVIEIVYSAPGDNEPAYSSAAGSDEPEIVTV